MNPLLAAFEFGKQQGDTAGYARGKDEAERGQRIDDGKGGAAADFNRGGGAERRTSDERFDGKNRGIGMRQIQELASGSRR
jgi:hypothetical protein